MARGGSCCYSKDHKGPCRTGQPRSARKVPSSTNNGLKEELTPLKSKIRNNIKNQERNRQMNIEENLLFENNSDEDNQDEISLLEQLSPGQTLNMNITGVQRGITEAQPWNAVNSNRSLNLGSYAVVASASAISKSQELLTKYANEIRNSDGSSNESRENSLPELPDIEKVEKLATTLLRICDNIHRATRGRRNRQENSHTRIRGLVYSVIDLSPPPFDASPSVKRTWERKVTNYCIELIGVLERITVVPETVETP